MGNLRAGQTNTQQLDNKHRANRVSQLCNDIAQLQTEVKEAVEDAKVQDQRAIVILEKIAKQRGFKTLDEFVDAAQKQLSEADRKRYEEMRKKLEKRDEAIDVAMTAGLGLAAIGLGAGPAAVSVTAVMFQHTMVSTTLKAIGVGLVKVITGSMSEGVDIFKVAANLLGGVLKGEALTETAAAAFRTLNVAGKILSAFGVTLDAVTSSYDAMDDKKQREELQKAINELCLRRLTTKKIQQYSRVALQFSSDAKAIADYTDSLQELVKNGMLDQSIADAQIAAKMQELEPKLSKDIGSVTDISVYTMLVHQDLESSIAWTDEDPSFEELEKQMDKHLEDAPKA